MSVQSHRHNPELLEQVRAYQRLNLGVECPYCSTEFVPHPGFEDHADRCALNPMNRPHIIGELNAATSHVGLLDATQL